MARGLNMSSAGIALLGLLAVKGFQHRDELGRVLGDVMGRSGGGQGSGSNPFGGGGSLGTGAGGMAGAGGLGGMLGGLGDMLGGQGSTGGVLKEGLGGLLDRFKQTGHAEEADSWVGTGPNRSVEPQHLEQALGPDVIEQLQSQTGLSREELLQRLSTNLPKTVDTLTPDGRLPTDEEADRILPPGTMH